jgi:hypothetical protein
MGVERRQIIITNSNNGNVKRKKGKVVVIDQEDLQNHME